MRLFVGPLVCAAAVLCPAAGAELSEEYRALLGAADARQSDAEFLETANLLATVAPGGRSDVIAAVAELAPRRMDVLEAWSEMAEPAAVTAAAGPVDAGAWIAEAEAESAAAARTPAGTAETAGTVRHWHGYADWFHPYHWDGQAKLGLAIDSGNTEQSDYNLAVELSRPLNGGWGFDGKLEYYYTENSGHVTRDRWLVEARGEQPSADRWSYFIGSSLEQDRMSGYDYSAVLAGGATYHPLDSERQSWILRAGPGVRHRVPVGRNGRTRWVMELGSVYDMTLTETAQLSSETTLLAGPEPRGEQRFKLTTAISDGWGVELGYRVKHEFDPQPDVEPTDSRLDFSIVRNF
jgi:putative salt-induced outer membrane protein YdiY